MKKRIGTAWLVLLMTVFASGSVMAADGKKEAVRPKTPFGLDEIWSGYHFAKKETQALQDDVFDNPGNLWFEEGASLWRKAEGKAGKSCQSCHNDAAVSMKGVATRYPVYYAPLKKLVNLEQRINLCRSDQMKAKSWKWKSKELLAMAIYVSAQSKGMPVAIKITARNRPFWEKGKAFYYKRRGQLDMSCAHCHEKYYGKHIRSNVLSQGQINGFPTYRLKWQKPGSVHRRFRGCNKQVRAKPFSFGSEAYNNLELYVKWRGNGLPVEAPAVRN